MNGVHGITRSVDNRNELEIISVLVDVVASPDLTDVIEQDGFFEEAVVH